MAVQSNIKDTGCVYNLRHRTHSLQLPARHALIYATFITRMLYKDTY